VSFNPDVVSEQERQLMEKNMLDHEMPIESVEVLKKVLSLSALMENTVGLQDCFRVYAAKLLASFPAWGGPDWIPDVEDCVRARLRTTGVMKHQMKIQNVPFELVDVGGQKAERRKWMHSAFYMCNEVSFLGCRVCSF
jgi:hypothetical protein